MNPVRNCFLTGDCLEVSNGVKVTYNWLKDFVEIKLSPENLAHKLTMAGLEVTSLEEKGGDFVFEIEVTPNRPDCLSVLGIAREVAAITGKKLKNVPRITYQVSGKNVRRAACGVRPFVIKIENKKDCPFYTAKIIRNLKVGPSAQWLKKRLELLGCRSVNNIVDITNYILFEYGEPLHAFDLDKLSGSSIVVRRAKRDEKLVTIDTEERKLTAQVLLIADENRAIAIAGVMGGKDTEVSLDTKNILIEAAVFNPLLVRNGRQILGLQSESSYRFERGVDGNIVDPASCKALKMIQEACGGELVLAAKAGSSSSEKKAVRLDVSRLDKKLGQGITLAEAKKILTSLGFKIKTVTANMITVEIPSYRQDINLEADLVEEVARVFGYENTATTLPSVKPRAELHSTFDLTFRIKQILTGLGLNEVITYSLVDKDLSAGLETTVSRDVIEILNPLSKEQEVLRPSLALSLASSVAYNLRQKHPYVNIFEVAKSYFIQDGKVTERQSLAIALCGRRTLWLGPANPHILDNATFLHLKGVIEKVFSYLGIPDCDFSELPGGGMFSCVLKNTGEALGLLMQLDIKNNDLFLAELCLEKVFSHIRLEKKYQPFPRYPGISRDISIAVKNEVTFEKITEIIVSRGGVLLQGVPLNDYYTGSQIGPGEKGITISCFYASPERTLSEADIEGAHQNIVNGLKEQLGARIR